MKRELFLVVLRMSCFPFLKLVLSETTPDGIMEGAQNFVIKILIETRAL